MTDWFARNPIVTMLRTVFAGIDSVVYSLMSYLYQIFFAIAETDILSGPLVSSIYYRVQLIIGVFMIFKLAVTILQGIMNPDSVFDKKAGMGNIITRIIVSLIMLTLMAPISIPASNEFERQVNTNGLLFGTLFSLQNRLLKNNTIGRIIIGTTDGINSVDSSSSLKQTGDLFSSTVLRTFVRINILPSAKDSISNGKDPGLNSANRVCPNLDPSVLKVYNHPKANASQLLALINVGCGDKLDGPKLPSLFGSAISKLIGTDHYAFSYSYFFSTVVGIIIDLVLIGYCLDVAIRVFKLAVLRLIAPIPIISHINISAKESKGADSFSLWVKSLTTTYLELFIRLAIIYFVLFVLKGMLINGIGFNQYSSNSYSIQMFIFLFIILGLMIFAKMAPTFIKNSLGLSGTNSSIGMAALLGMGGAVANGGGVYGALAAGMNSVTNTVNANNQGKAAPPAWQTGSDLAEQIKTGDSKAKGGFENRLNDYFMRQGGIITASKYGVSAAGIKEAKNIYLDLESDADTKKDTYDRFIKGGFSQAQMETYATNHGITLSGDAEADKETVRQFMYTDFTKAQTSAAKAKSNYEDAKKFGDSHRVSPSFEEEHRPSLVEKFGLGSRPYRGDSYKATSRRRSGHQTYNDMIFGQPDDWMKPLSDDNPRTDNRWNSKKHSGQDTNALHDDANTNTNTPGRN